MSDLVKEFGMEGGLLLALIGACIYTLRWTASNVVMPLTTAGIEFIKDQSQLQNANTDAIIKISEAEIEIRRHVQQMVDTHKDKDSTFSTVHTNIAISILAKAVGRVADCIDGCEVKDLVKELQKTLNKQSGD